MEPTKAQHDVHKLTVGYNNINRSIKCAYMILTRQKRHDQRPELPYPPYFGLLICGKGHFMATDNLFVTKSNNAIDM